MFGRVVAKVPKTDVERFLILKPQSTQNELL